MNRSLLSRREALAMGGVATAGLLAGNLPALARAEAATSSRERVLRLAHLTDIHVQPELRANDGMTACLHHVQQLTDRPELIITGGDSVMDSFGADDARTQQQWDLWTATFKNECSLPVKSCIGNHDVWGWNKTSSHTTGGEPNWGKRRAEEMLHLDKRYYTFAQAGWQFVVLDSVQTPRDGKPGYEGYLDDEQYDWLAGLLRDLDAATPVLLVSHIPILTATVLLDESDPTKVSADLIHADRFKLKQLFAQHPNVKAALSGHIHLVDRVDYNGVSYLCNGAVCGSWWKGRHKDCDEGYAVLNLYNDGSLEREYINYGWQAAT